LYLVRRDGRATRTGLKPPGDIEIPASDLAALLDPKCHDGVLDAAPTEARLYVHVSVSVRIDLTDTNTNTIRRNNMSSFVGPLTGFAATAFIIVLLRPLAVTIGLVDVPSVRKSHEGEVPLIGGLAILLGICVSVLAFGLATGTKPWVEPGVSSFLIAAALLVGVGVWDDLRELSAFTKFTAQIIAALLMIFGAGVVLTDLGHLSMTAEPLRLGIFAVPFTVFTTLGIINAVNMSDGLDGLAGSLVLVSLLGLGIANFASGGEIGVTMFVLTVASTTAGFLIFNLRMLWRTKASVFLGDAGSTLLGFVLCWLAISLTQGETKNISPATALWFLMVPIFDAVSMMVRRIVKRRSPFEADREHLHHIFLMAGFTVGETVGIISAIAAAGGVIGLGGIFFGVADYLMAGLFAVTGLLYLWVIMRAWKVKRFLRRSICRRRNISDRRSQIDRRGLQDSAYSGAERRSGRDRRQPVPRRAPDETGDRPVLLTDPSG